MYKMLIAFFLINEDLDMLKNKIKIFNSQLKFMKKLS